jgi:hypothetical protein
LGQGRKSPTLTWHSLGFANQLVPHEIYFTPELASYATWSRYSPLGEIEPFLVLPGYGKAFDVRSLATLWYKPEWVFAFTHDIHIIGLSLAEDDFFIRSFFLDNLPYIASRPKKPSRKILIINPSKEVERNYSFVLGNDSVKLFHEPFSMEHIDTMRAMLAD